MRIAVVQQPAYGRRVAANTSMARQYVWQGAARGADIVLFPEMWNIGYQLPAAAEAASAGFRRWAAEAQEEYLTEISLAALAAGVAIVATYLEVTEDGLRNAAALVDRTGTTVLRYAKVHVAAFAGEAVLQPGQGFPTAELRLSDGRQVRAGLMLCYDRVFPESARALAHGGAELVLVPNASPLCTNRLWQVRTRAFENKFAVAVANYPGGPMAGRSIVCDGIAFDESGRPREHTVLLAGEDPETCLTDVPLSALRAYRAAQPWGLPSSLDGRTPVVQRDPAGDLDLLHGQV